MTERWTARDAAALLRAPGQHDDKYRRGVLGVRTGAAGYPGAAVLGVSAAWRAGCGMIRYVPPEGDPEPAFGLPSAAAAVLAVRPETVFGPPTGRGCDAWLIGSGTDPATRSDAEGRALRAILSGPAPVIVDAGALSLAVAPHFAAPAVLTPHAGEFERLWSDAQLGGLPDGWDPRTADTATRAHAAVRLARELGVTVLLKGSVTVSATPAGWVRAIGPATPWLASAGTGDVLAGIAGALVAGHAAHVRADPEMLGQIGATAALLHDRAARLASGADDARVGGPITAGDVVEAIPAAIAALLR